MRARVGDRIVVFDNSGDQFTADVRSLGRNQVILSIGERQTISLELKHTLVAGVALPKGDRQRWLVIWG